MKGIWCKKQKIHDCDPQEVWCECLNDDKECYYWVLSEELDCPDFEDVNEE